MSVRDIKRVTTNLKRKAIKSVGNPSYIEINGKRYDARTGKVIQEVKPSHFSDVIRTKSQVSRSKIQHNSVHAAQQKGKTLMRHAVKKPTPTKKPNISSKIMADVVAPVKSVQNHATRIYNHLDEKRITRANSIKRSNLVSKFGPSLSASHSGKNVIEHKIETMAVQPAPVNLNHHKSHVVHKSKAGSLIENGLRNAQSHKQPAPKVKTRKSRNKIVSVMAVSLSVLLLGSFFAYQYMPNVTMRYASTRAGVSAALPGYQPSGFAMSRKIDYTPGQITISFRSNTDDRAFTITQKNSNWNSNNLMENYVASRSNQIQTYQDKGRTIYLYDGNNATWVNGGVWYEINGDSKLTSDQLVRIAASM